jgi:hypothetical protein
MFVRDRRPAAHANERIIRKAGQRYRLGAMVDGAALR